MATAPATRVPPQNIEAEESVLGAMLISEPALTRVIDEVKLNAADFYLGRHRAIFEAAHDLYAASEPVDGLTVAAALTKRQREPFEKAGVEPRHYISELAAKVPAAGNAKHYAEIVQEDAVLRRLIEQAQLVQESVYGRNGEGSYELHRRAAEGFQRVSPAAELAAVDRWANGATFILDAPDHVPARWGRDDEVLQADGEPLLIAAPPGAGKTTLAQQLAIALAGIGADHLLGFPVSPIEGKVIYVAADRPAQAARSFRRMVGEDDREALAERLEVWRGPLPFNLTAEPGRLAPFLKARDAGAVVIDSLGAVAFDLASDEAGSRVFAALSEATAEGIEVVALHHDRKREQGSDRVRTLDDVYGSRWITAAAGSVLYLDARAGDLIVKLRQLKQPAAEIGPLTIRHDHDAGRTVIHEPADLLDLVSTGVTVKQAAALLFELSDPSPNEIEKTRRRLDKLADRGDLERVSEQGEPTIYRRAS
jgi:replicative DNA helicase